MICRCLRKTKLQKNHCAIPCRKLETELGKIEIAQTEMTVTNATLALRIDSKIDIWETPSHERMAIIGQAFERLPERQRQCLEGYFGLGGGVAVNARRLGLSRGTTRVHIYRGLKRIYDALDEPVPKECWPFFLSEAPNRAG